jgi:hypothetical protein
MRAGKNFGTRPVTLDGPWCNWRNEPRVFAMVLVDFLELISPGATNRVPRSLKPPYDRI